jgi:hypothetical protein
MTDIDILWYDLLLASIYMAVDDGVMSCYVMLCYHILRAR